MARKFLAATAAVLMVASVIASPVAAQTQSPPAAEPSSRSMALVKRMFSAAGLDRQFSAMWEGMVPMFEQDAAVQKLTPQQRTVLIDTVREVMVGEVMPKLTAKMAREYALNFTEAELEAIVAFYESPAGKAAVEKTPMLVQRSMGYAQEMLPEAQTEVMRRACEKLDCGTGAPKARPS